MSTATQTGQVPIHDEGDHEAGHAHPTEKQYWKVGFALALITLLEVSTYFIADPPYDHDLKWVLIISLLVMMVAKFAIIGAWFMHLRFDSKLFQIAFVSGLVLAVVVYLVVLTAFEYWDSGYEGATALLL